MPVGSVKPVALIERAIRNSSKRRDIVLDPFGGSGSTLIAAEKTGRQARLVELDPRYVDVIARRWQEVPPRWRATGGRSRIVQLSTSRRSRRPPKVPAPHPPTRRG
jgi:DNA modification methylase